MACRFSSSSGSADEQQQQTTRPPLSNHRAPPTPPHPIRAPTSFETTRARPWVPAHAPNNQVRGGRFSEVACLIDDERGPAFFFLCARRRRRRRPPTQEAAGGRAGGCRGGIWTGSTPVTRDLFTWEGWQSIDDDHHHHHALPRTGDREGPAPTRSHALLFLLLLETAVAATTNSSIESGLPRAPAPAPGALARARLPPPPCSCSAKTPDHGCTPSRRFTDDGDRRLQQQVSVGYSLVALLA